MTKVRRGSRSNVDRPEYADRTAGNQQELVSSMSPTVASNPFADRYLDDHSVQPALTPIQNELNCYCEWLSLRGSPVYYGVGVARGHGQAVVLVPGFMGTDLTMMELYWWLVRIGYRPYYSGLGLNVNCPDTSTERILSVVERAATETGAAVHLIGHSLGALIARSAAFTRPEQINQLISLAAPFNDVAHVHPVLIEAMNAVRGQAGSQLTWNIAPACYSGHCTCSFIENIMRPRRPTFRRHALFAERDGLVRPESCMEEEPECNIGIATSHYGMLYSKQAYQEIARILSGSPEQETFA